MKTCLVVTGGKTDEAFARSFLLQESIQKIIAVDRGLETAGRLGLVPDYLVGDFDSVDPQVLAEYKKLPFIVWEHHKPEKNQTDTELARNRAMTLGCDRIFFLGATGGRLDHMLANIHTLYVCMQKGVEAYLVDAQNRVSLLDEGRTFCRSSQWGKYISFLPYTDRVTGITLEGFRYPLTGKNLKKGQEPGLCISNELAEEYGTLRFSGGVLVCMETRD